MYGPILGSLLEEALMFPTTRAVFPEEEPFCLVGCFGLNGPLRQYFSLYQAISQREREGERKEK